MKQYAFHAIVQGKVQGVGFRYYTVKEAEKMNLKGWVKNLRSGEVEVWAEGTQEKLKHFYEWLQRGPGSSRVDYVDKDDMIPRDYEEFTVEY